MHHWSAEVFTTFLLGSKQYGYTLVPQVDAPEYGVCKPDPSHAVEA